MIVWRIDDVNFAGTMEGRPTPVRNLRRLVSCFECRGMRVSLSVITRYGGSRWSADPERVALLHELVGAGHQILAHGAAHDKDRPYTDMDDAEIRAELEEQRSDFEAMGLDFDWFCYPFNHRTARTNRLVREAGLQIVQEDFSGYHKISTVTKWRNPALSQEKLRSIEAARFDGPNLLVEDHVWFYGRDEAFGCLERTLDGLGGVELVTPAQVVVPGAGGR